MQSSEREQFEAWIRTQEGHPFAGQFGNLMWKAWQARAALSAPPADRVIEVLRAERGMAQAQRDHAVRILTGIHALLYPPPTTVEGKTYVFQPDTAGTDMQRLCDAIRAIPDQLAAAGVRLGSRAASRFAQRAAVYPAVMPDRAGAYVSTSSIVNLMRTRTRRPPRST